MRIDAYRRPAVAGAGAIATGLAAVASTAAEKVVVLARSDDSAAKAERLVSSAAGRLDGADASRVEITTNAERVARCDLVVEAIVEHTEAKAELISKLGHTAPDADLATTTSSLSVTEIAASADMRHRLFGLHVFNPVIRMKLVELCLPATLAPGIGERARQWCAAVGKTAVEVPDTAGFVVNRLLFPYLFDAVRLMEANSMSAEAVDSCMTLGAAYPMGPLALLDLIGLDVAIAIGEALHAESGDPGHLAPERLGAMAAEGRLGRKSGTGFYSYD